MEYFEEIKNNVIIFKNILSLTCITFSLFLPPFPFAARDLGDHKAKSFKFETDRLTARLIEWFIVMHLAAKKISLYISMNSQFI